MTSTVDFSKALRQHKITSKVVDVDHHRSASRLSVHTDYIIHVKGVGKEFESIDYLISKTYSQFRIIASKLRKAADVATHGMKSSRDLTKDAKYLIKFADGIHKIVDAERVEYFSKVSFGYVKKMSKERTLRLNDALNFMTTHFPVNENKDAPGVQNEESPGVWDVIVAVETFFLTDHVVEDDESINSKNMARNVGRSSSSSPREAPPSIPTTIGANSTPAKTNNSRPTGVSARTIKKRKSLVMRAEDEKLLTELGKKEGGLLFKEPQGDEVGEKEKPPPVTRPVTVPQNHDSAPKKTALAPRSTTKPSGNKVEDIIDGIVVCLALCVVVYVLQKAARKRVELDGDFAILFSFAFFCLGVRVSSGRNAPTKADSQKKVTIASAEAPASEKKSLILLRKSMSTANLNALRQTFSAKNLEDEADDVNEPESEPRPLIVSPLPTFPEHGDPHTDLNCTSQPACTCFHVRGPKYLSDKKKVPSGEFLFPFRGVDLFLTDECPENVGRNSAIMGGKLRDVPTFLLNFRLPWGVLIAHFEIPPMFIPFVRKRYEPSANVNLPSMETMTPAQRCACRYLMGDDEHKKQTLKLLPMVVIGPWIVKGVVGTKPAIIGNKLPVNYVYQPPEPNGKALYLEADLDIVASAAARKILSVVRSATQGLTIDLGFLCEGKKPDELPEQMLIGARLHGLDPLNASLLPPMPHDVFNVDEETDDESMVTSR